MALDAYLLAQLQSLTGKAEELPPLRCLLALSGGVDSMALLYAALPLYRSGKISLAAVHVHHGIRAQEAERDAAFCQLTCERERVPFHLCRVDVPRQAKEKKQSVEVAARHARYACFESLCQEHGYDWVLTAHHLDDQIETVLLRLLRGASPKGLCGIAPRRGRYLRPFLSLYRADLLAFCEAQEVAYVEDSTNSDLHIPRNYLRKQVIPHLKHLQPNLGATLSRAVAELKEEQECMDALLASMTPTDAIKTLQALPPPLLRRHLVQRYHEAGGVTLAKTHLDATVSLVQSGQTGQRVDLPDGMCARVRYGRLCFEKRLSPLSFVPFVLKEGWNPLPNGAAIFYTRQKKEAKQIPNIYKFETSVILNSATIVGSLVCRPRRAGDTVQMAGMTRKPKNLFQTHHLDESTRTQIPFLCDDAGVVYIPFVGACDRVAPQSADALCYLFYTKEMPPVT